MMESQQLLAQYASTGSEAAFRELVARYVNLVYSTAVRAVGGDTHLAEDVAQTVFVHLATKGRRLPPDVMLGGWLHKDTCYVAATMLRGTRRRQARERQAAEMNAQPDHTLSNLSAVTSLLDDAIEKLGPDDRAAILLRFFEQRDFHSLGEALGTTEEAARKRVARALEKLHAVLEHEAVGLSAAALATGLAAEAVTAAPSGLAAGIVGPALAGATSKGLGVAIFKTISAAKVKFAVLATIALAAALTPVVVQRQSGIKLREQNQALRQELQTLGQLRAENTRLSNLLAEANGSASLAENQANELLKLRSEVSRLRQARPNPAPRPGTDSQAETTAASPGFYFVSGAGIAIPNRQVFQAGLTVTRAITNCGGFTETAVKTNVMLTRAGSKTPLVIDVTAVEQGRAEDPEILAGDALFVPDERFVSGH